MLDGPQSFHSGSEIHCSPGDLLLIAPLASRLASGTAALLLRVQPKYENIQHKTLPLIPFGTAKNRLEDFF